MSETNDLPGQPTDHIEGEAETPPAPAESQPEVPPPVTSAPVPEGDATGEPAPEAADTGAPPPGEESPAAAEAAPAPRPKRRPKDAAVARAFRLGLPVEGRVEQVIKGGYEVRVGRSRGFCPHSQIDLHRVDQPEEYVGKSYAFRILQMRRGGEDLVLSRRALLEAEKAEEAKAVRATLLEGTVMLGRVAGLADFGAFVDLGAGVMGLVHLSELAHSRVAKVSDAVQVGERVRVKILKLDDHTGRISLSIRQAEEDPWVRLAQAYPVGSVHRGKVLRVTAFGAFVEMARGVEALAPAREFPPAVEGFEASLTPGIERDWLVLSVEPDRKRMSIAPAPEPGSPEAAKVEVGARLQGKVQKAERFGVFVWLGPGKVGLVPAAMTGVPRGTDLGRKFATGQDLEVEVSEVAEDGRIRLSLPGVEPAPAPAPRGPAPTRKGADRPRRDRDRERGRERREEMPQPAAGSGSFGTSLGDLLRAAMDNKKD
ncbi:MAG TPA: S1 RNA-binding domain-containing protein [Candidatus Polarisedimenticolaceae bacterium]|nr:S1 RNA-binding domain-containing protein [Candidatus Polarisedimenticolaceae bacterium]